MGKGKHRKTKVPEWAWTVVTLVPDGRMHVARVEADLKARLERVPFVSLCETVVAELPRGVNQVHAFVDVELADLDCLKGVGFDALRVMKPRRAAL